jgi:hypothetical protein
MPRFVILDHDWPVPHWDLMLEVGDVLRTWRLASLPAAEQVSAAEAIGDHRLAYLTYEGPVSGDRGRVIAWDRGTFEWVEEGTELVVIVLQGERLRGTLRLQGKPGGGWEVAFKANEGL